MAAGLACLADQCSNTVQLGTRCSSSANLLGWQQVLSACPMLQGSSLVRYCADALLLERSSCQGHAAIAWGDALCFGPPRPAIEAPTAQQGKAFRPLGAEATKHGQQSWRCCNRCPLPTHVQLAQAAGLGAIMSAVHILLHGCAARKDSPVIACRVLVRLLWKPQTATVGASRPSPDCASASPAALACQRWEAQLWAAQAPLACPQEAMPEGSLLLPRGCAAALASRKTGIPWLALRSCSRGARRDRCCTSRCAAWFNVLLADRLGSLVISRRGCRVHHCISKSPARHAAC